MVLFTKNQSNLYQKYILNMFPSAYTPGSLTASLPLKNDGVSSQGVYYIRVCAFKKRADKHDSQAPFSRKKKNTPAFLYDEFFEVYRHETCPAHLDDPSEKVDWA